MHALFSAISSTPYRNNLKNPDHRGEVWSLELHSRHWPLDFCLKVSPQACVHPHCMCSCPLVLFPYISSNILCPYSWSKIFPLCCLLVIWTVLFPFPVFSPEKSCLDYCDPWENSSFWRQGNMGCTKLTILFNPSFALTTFHHSTRLMPSICAFD